MAFPVFLLYPVSAYQLQHNAHWCGEVALNPNLLLRKSHFWDCFCGDNKTTSENQYRRTTLDAQTLMCLLLCLVFVRTDKLLTYLRSVLLLWGREAQRYYRAHTAGSHGWDGPAGYLQKHQQNTSGSYALGTSWSYMTLWEGWTNGPPSWTSIRPIYQGKPFPFNTSTLRAQRVLPCWIS